MVHVLKHWLSYLQDVESLMDCAESLSVRCGLSKLWSLLINGAKWLKKALEAISFPCHSRRVTLSDVEEVLAASQVFKFIFVLHIATSYF